MEENIFPEKPTYKLFSDRSVYTATFLGGPLVAGYLFAEDFRKLGKFGKVKMAWFLSILATIVIFGVVLFVPDVEKIPKIFIPLAYSLGAQALAKHELGADLREHAGKGGELYSIWLAVVAGIIGLALTIGMLILFLYVTDQPFSLF